MTQACGSSWGTVRPAHRGAAPLGDASRRETGVLTPRRSVVRLRELGKRGRARGARRCRGRGSHSVTRRSPGPRARPVSCRGTASPRRAGRVRTRPPGGVSAPRTAMTGTHRGRASEQRGGATARIAPQTCLPLDCQSPVGGTGVRRRSRRGTSPPLHWRRRPNHPSARARGVGRHWWTTPGVRCPGTPGYARRDGDRQEEPPGKRAEATAPLPSPPPHPSLPVRAKRRSCRSILSSSCACKGFSLPSVPVRAPCQPPGSPATGHTVLRPAPANRGASRAQGAGEMGWQQGAPRSPISHRALWWSCRGAVGVARLQAAGLRHATRSHAPASCAPLAPILL